MVQAAQRLLEREPALIKATQYGEQLLVNLGLRGQVEGWRVPFTINLIKFNQTWSFFVDIRLVLPQLTFVTDY